MPNDMYIEAKCVIIEGIIVGSILKQLHVIFVYLPFRSVLMKLKWWKVLQLR